MKLSNGVVMAIFYGLGVLTTYTFFKNKYEKKYNEDIEEYRTRILKMYGIEEPDEKDEESGKGSDNTAETGKTKSSLDTDFKRSGKSTAYYEQYKYVPAEDRESPTEEDKDDDVNADPYEIDIDTYFSDKLYSKIPVIWYTEDDTYAYQEVREDDPEIMDDEHTAFGYAIERSGFKGNDAMVIYIRNPQTKSDYEVTKCYGAYNT